MECLGTTLLEYQVGPNPKSQIPCPEPCYKLNLAVQKNVLLSFQAMTTKPLSKSRCFRPIIALCIYNIYQILTYQCLNCSILNINRFQQIYINLITKQFNLRAHSRLSRKIGNGIYIPYFRIQFLRTLFFFGFGNPKVTVHMAKGHST